MFLFLGDFILFCESLKTGHITFLIYSKYIIIILFYLFMKNMTLFDNKTSLSTVMDTSTYVEETIQVLKNGMPFGLSKFFSFFPFFLSLFHFLYDNNNNNNNNNNNCLINVSTVIRCFLSTKIRLD